MRFKSLSRLSYLSVLLLVACAEDAAPPPSAPEAVAPTPSALTKALDALGGAEALSRIETVSIMASGQRFELDEHYVPGDVDEIPVPFTMRGYYDAASDSLRLDLTRSRPTGEHSASLIVNGEFGVIVGQDAQFGPPEATIPMTSDRWAAVRKEQSLLNPQIAYRDELASGLVTVAADEMVDGVNHHVLIIDAPVAPIRLYIDAASGEISKLTTMETEHLRRDVAIEVAFDDWARTDAGVAFPNEIVMRYDGETIHEETRTSFAVNMPLAADLFELPAGASPTFDATLAEWGRSGHQIYQIMASLGFPRSGQDTNIETEQLAPGVHHVRGGSHHSLVVEQESGIVVAEAPLHELRSEAVIAWIESTFPGKPITHVIATHHHTDHSAGLRAFIARGASVVVHEAARDFFADIFARPSTLRPDALAENPRTASIETMPAEGSYTIEGNPAVSVYPLTNPHAADLVFIYVPDAGIVFQSDIYNPNPNAPAGPGGASLQAAIEAAGVDVSLIAGGHGGTIEYSVFESLL